MSMEMRILKRKKAVAELSIKNEEHRELVKIERREKIESAKRRVEANVVKNERVRKI